ncbi:hypothetical protein ACP70R_007094 [Stipagrostis hirtigluma subsp. patula]
MGSSLSRPRFVGYFYFTGAGELGVAVGVEVLAGGEVRFRLVHHQPLPYWASAAALFVGAAAVALPAGDELSPLMEGEDSDPAPEAAAA